MKAQNGVLGLHHVTAFCGSPQRNVDYYAGILGLRTVKVTVNHDDVKTYHLYYGTGDARPGSFITFFPWPESYRGRVGNGQSTATAYSIPKGSMDWWIQRLNDAGAPVTEPFDRFGDKVLSTMDPDEACVELVESGTGDSREPSPWLDMPADKAILGFHNVTFTVPELDGMHKLLTEQMGYEPLSQDDKLHRYKVGQGQSGEIIDLIVDPTVPFGRDGVGTTHHVAFRTKGDDHEMALRADIVEAGHHITPQIDRNYFHSLYFRTPGGPLFEIATDPPGMTYDEPMETLGQALHFPDHAKGREEEIRRGLAEFTTPDGVSFP